MKTIHVNIKNNEYDVNIGVDILKDIGSLVKDISKTFVIITDDNTDKLYAKTVEDSLKKENLTVHKISFPHGEKNKTRKTKEKIEDELISLKVNRDWCIIALGGGVTGDMAGFVAATTLRGIPFIQVPTSLLAMADSSIGGKVAVDHPLGKNLIGAFKQPKMVISDIATLKTLPKKELLNGLSETIKHALIADKEFVKYLKDNTEKILNLEEEPLLHIVQKNTEIKSKVVAEDEKESGARKILNYGHTIGHAIEVLSDFKMSHGEAVALGMYYEAKIAVEIGVMSKEDEEGQNNLLKDMKLIKDLPQLDIEKTIEATRLDKKAREGQAEYSLINNIGECKHSIRVEESIIKKVLGE